MRETAENREMTKRKSLKIEKKSYISVAWWEDVSGEFGICQNRAVAFGIDFKN